MKLCALAATLLLLGAAEGVRAASYSTGAFAYDYIDDPYCEVGPLQPGPAGCSQSATVGSPGLTYYHGSSASGFASLASGQLNAHVSTFGVYQTGPNSALYGEGSASAQLSDTIYFGTQRDVLPTDIVTVTWTTDFEYQTLHNFPGPFGNDFGVSSASMELQVEDLNGTLLTRAFACSPTDNLCLSGVGFGSYVISTNGNFKTISATYNISQFQDYGLQLFLKAGATSSGEAFGTAAGPVRISLPDGLGFTSESGIFLTQAPEPTAGALFASAVLVLSLLRRR